ncbi:MAG TPA: HAD family hydrolase [Holophaga sp.]|nr:HAD family hydrolase [Holophaga sp.]
MKLIVWDFDGTLADSRPLIVAGMEHTLLRLGLQDRPGLREAWLRQVGLPVEEGLARTFEGMDMDPARVLEVYRTFDWRTHEHLIQPFPGMSELVHELHGLGVPMAIASSKRTVPLTRQVATLGWEGCFSPLVTPDDVRLGKPHPESLEICLAAHGAQPGDCLMIGDTPFDLEMAERAHVPGVAVGHGFYGREALLECRPLAYAPDVPALRRILLAWVTP